MQSLLSDSYVDGDGVDTSLMSIAATSTRRAIDAFFTVLYGIYPKSTITAMQAANDRKFEKPPGSETAFEPAQDPYMLAKQKLMDLDVLDEQLLVKRRITVS
jgi:hypothetical protein